MLLSSKMLLSSLEDLGRAGTWTYDLETGELAWSDGLYRLLGMVPGSVRPGLEAIAVLYDPARRPELEMRFLSVARGNIKRFKSPVNLPNGTRRWIASQSEIMLGREGLPKNVIGVVFDVTEQELAVTELGFRNLVRRNIGERLGIFVLEPNHEIGNLDEAGWLNFTGIMPAELRQLGWKSSIVQEQRERVSAEIKALGRKRGSGVVSFNWVDGKGLTHRGFLAVFGLKLADVAAQERVSLLVMPAEGIGPTPPVTEVPGKLIRAGRVVAGWSVAQLADTSGVSIATISRLEASSLGRTRAKSLVAVTQALATAGVRYTPAPNGSIALLLDKRVVLGE